MSLLANSEYRKMLQYTNKLKLQLFEQIREDYKHSAPMISFLKKMWSKLINDTKDLKLSEAKDMILDAITQFKALRYNSDELEGVYYYAYLTYRINKFLNTNNRLFNKKELDLLDRFNTELYIIYTDSSIFNLPNLDETLEMTKDFKYFINEQYEKSKRRRQTPSHQKR